MQSQVGGVFDFVMVYNDHSTKFVQLSALKTKGAEKVDCHLLDVFPIFGAFWKVSMSEAFITWLFQKFGECGILLNG